MAKETAYEKQLREAYEKLPDIVAATLSEPGYMFTNFLVHSHLVQQGLVEVNAELTNEAGDEATRATEAGINYVKEHGLTIVANAEPANAVNQAAEPKPKGNKKMAFEIENIAVTASPRGGGNRAPKYPFASLEVGQSFFVPGDKFGASTLSNAMKPYDVLVFEEDGVTPKMKEIIVPKTGEKRMIQCTKHTRIFTATQGTKEIDGVLVNGFRVGRTQ